MCIAYECTNIKVEISCVVIAKGHTLLPLCLLKHRFVKCFAMLFGCITLVYGLPVGKLMTDLLMTLLNTCHFSNDIQVTPKIMSQSY